VKRLIKNESGQALILTLLMLLISGLIAAPLLSYMGTGLLSGEVYETRTAELYAADAGVEDAIWKIENKDGYLPCNPASPPRVYSITDVNDQNVDVTITSEISVNNITFTYLVLSTATGDGSGTQIEAYIGAFNKYGDYGDLLGQVITSQNEIDFSPHWEDYVEPSEGEHAPVEYYSDPWPTAEELIDFYLDEVEDVEPYGSDTIDLNGVDQDLGPFYRNGELEIYNSSSTNVTLTLTGTVYITGDTVIGSTNKGFTLDLNNQTIFVASNSSNPQKALWIGGKCTIRGPGVVIAVGDIYFEPNMDAGVSDPIFVFSVSGITNVQPGGDFYGAIAGSVEVDLQPGTSVNYPTEGGWYDDLNFLIGIKKLDYRIDSWEVIQQ